MNLILPAIARAFYNHLPIQTVRIGGWEWPEDRPGGWYFVRHPNGMTICLFDADVSEKMLQKITEWANTLAKTPAVNDHALEELICEIAMDELSSSEEMEWPIPPSPDPELAVDWSAVLRGLARRLMALGRIADEMEDERADRWADSFGPKESIQIGTIAIWPDPQFYNWNTIVESGLHNSISGNPLAARLMAVRWMDWMAWRPWAILKAIRDLRMAEEWARAILNDRKNKKAGIGRPS